eukprot:CAMPEP_0180598706 /NCGR_PEP_ID=MMETSP1037_2-20121125/23009_1 /TAXON_ID=632150 /ORGANISM="Azadinium spinosum, Strain 3D9" /LENGTH=530 /DNA_ID=CAMNT_0022617335 /DNA_START=88 /DNA_END=1677 /DNA_ORIENTATION=+
MARLATFTICFLIAVAAPNAARSDNTCEGEDGCNVGEIGISLLQFNLMHDLAVEPPHAEVGSDPNLGVEYPLALYFGLDSAYKRPDVFHGITRSAEQCASPIMAAVRKSLTWMAGESELVPSNFLFRECPHPLQGISRRVGSGLNNRSSGALKGPGFNPSFVPLPAHLSAQFPAGRWLMILRVGGKDSTVACPGNARVQHSAPEFSRKSLSDWVSRVVILDQNFETIAQAKVEMRGGDPFWDSTGITDAKIIDLGNGDLILGFNAYSWDHSPHYTVENPDVERDPDGFWRTHELVGLLQVKVDHNLSRLEAWVDHNSTLIVQECSQRGMYAPGPKKNLGFFKHAGTGHLQVMDWIHPTHVGKLNTQTLHDAPTNTSKHIAPVCYGYYEGAEAPELGDIMAGVLNDTLYPAELHNGPNLVWINETAEYLGIGHFYRGWMDKSTMNVGKDAVGTSHHYMHFFFTLSRGPPYKLQRLSPEFCFSSAHRPSDCESVQYASSIVLDGDNLHIGYGITDCEAAVMTVDTVEVLNSL